MTVDDKLVKQVKEQVDYACQHYIGSRLPDKIDRIIDDSKVHLRGLVQDAKVEAHAESWKDLYPTFGRRMMAKLAYALCWLGLFSRWSKSNGVKWYHVMFPYRPCCIMRMKENESYDAAGFFEPCSYVDTNEFLDEVIAAIHNPEFDAQSFLEDLIEFRTEYYLKAPDPSKIIISTLFKPIQSMEYVSISCTCSNNPSVGV